MTRDIVSDNIDCYASEQARKDWSADAGLYPVEQAIIERYFPQPPARILDLGCGAGRTTLGLEMLGYQVDAIDISENLVAAARSRVARSRVRLMDARELDFPDATFDAALFSFNGLDCLYPSRERLRVLGEVLRVIRPGAVFYYSGHNGLGAWAPRPGDRLIKVARRNLRMLRAQRAAFSERLRYLAYPDPAGTQVLYSAPPQVHLREIAACGFEPIAVYGARGASYRSSTVVDEIDVARRTLRSEAALARIAISHPHVHYIAKRPE